MSAFKIFSFIVVLGLIAFTSHVEANCAQCSLVSYAACINETSFVVCYDGQTPSTQVITCKEGTICTAQQGICKPKDSSFPECVLTDQCNSCAGTFACVSKTDFAYCDTDGKFTVTAACEKGYYCSINKFIIEGTICVPSCLVEPSCSNTEILTTPAPELDWKETCDAATAAGYYLNIHDSTCKTYVYCEMYNNVMDAVLFKCTSGYYNQTTKKCQETKPTGCK